MSAYTDKPNNETLLNETLLNETLLNETLLNETLLNETLEGLVWQRFWRNKALSFTRCKCICII